MAKSTLRIRNHLGNNLPLKLHCRSDKDDLGAKVLPHHYYKEWSFDLNFLKSNLVYSCKMEWRDGSGRFEIIVDPFRCHNKCDWSGQGLLSGTWLRPGTVGVSQGLVESHRLVVARTMGPWVLPRHGAQGMLEDLPCSCAHAAPRRDHLSL
ncbi:hypothetical protein Scep_019595 [Stephania cephalantha]|uniref:S-protein homolog n=1 Tax=Stephania cephalantha TaxID=152367 RepID=A0AAP0NPZ1_9MAGN